jgi:anti-sigma B factor antagonist
MSRQHALHGTLFLHQGRPVMPLRRTKYPPPRDPSTESTLSFAAVAVGPVTVLQAGGDLDIMTAPIVTNAVEEIVAAHSPLLLVLDLQELRFLGAAGITALEHLADVLGDHGGHLNLRRPPEHVRWVLTLAQVIDEFDIKDDVPATGGQAWSP